MQGSIIKTFKKIKNALAFLTALMLIWGVIFVYNRLTDGFSIREIHSSLKLEGDFNTSLFLSDSQKKELQQILAQKFHYIGKGCQSYAFESEDGCYVLKFFKHKHLRPMTWLKTLPMTSKWRAYCDAKIENRKERALRLFSSCKLAYEELSEETGVIYLHLNHEPVFQQTVDLVDKIGLNHTISLDDYEYVLQKKALPAGKALLTLLDEYDEIPIRNKIHQLSSLVKLRCEKGIRDRDHSFVQNVAFAIGEERAIFVDIGQFFKDEVIKNPEEIKKEILIRLSMLRFWAQERHPKLLPYIDEEIGSFQTPSSSSEST